MTATSSDDANRPADGSAERLSGDLRREVADFEVRIEEALLRADALRLTGDVSGAERVDHEQQDLLGELENRLQAHVAAAFVAREAERVVAGSLLDADPSWDMAGPIPVSTDDRGFLRRGIGSMAGALALAAAVALVSLNGQVGNFDVSAVRDAIANAVGRVSAPNEGDAVDPSEAAIAGSRTTADGVAIEDAAPNPLTPNGSDLGSETAATAVTDETPAVDATVEDLAALGQAAADAVSGILPTELPLPQVEPPRDDEESSDSTPSESPSTDDPSESETESETETGPLAPQPSPSDPSDEPTSTESDGSLVTGPSEVGALGNG